MLPTSSCRSSLKRVNVGWISCTSGMRSRCLLLSRVKFYAICWWNMAVEVIDWQALGALTVPCTSVSLGGAKSVTCPLSRALPFLVVRILAHTAARCLHADRCWTITKLVEMLSVVILGYGMDCMPLCLSGWRRGGVVAQRGSVAPKATGWTPWFLLTQCKTVTAVRLRASYLLIAYRYCISISA